MIQTHCPDADRLRALITDPDLPDYADLETHLAHCSRCQARLDEIAVGDSGWLNDAGRLAGSTAPDPELTKTLHRLHDFGLDDSHVPPISLDFLTPSNQPGLLGTLGRYQVLDVIGRGAMGIVLKAIDPDLLRPVAIKVLAPYLASSGTARQRFLREARAAAAVSHDHIVTIHAVEPGELPYIVMEFISGISLQARLDRDGPLPPRDIARIGLQAANGLAAAHAVGLVHRDIKPANILLENGVERVKITDFGLARAADDARLTQSGTAAGTPLYMSPEQTRGETVDQRSDLFSLGSVLYTLATGFPPFRAGSTMGVLNRIANDPPRPIRETVPDFPAALEAIIMQLLEKDPAQRFQVAADVSVKLTGYLNDPQAAVSRTEAPRRRRLPKWWETTLPILAGIAVLGIVLVVNTPRGTIVIESDDPNVKVAVDGEEVVLSGTGVAQVRVKPGEYHVRATRDGRPVTADPETVTIAKDGKQVVKITVKPPAPKAAGNPVDADLKRMEEDLGRLMQQLVQMGRLKPGSMDPQVARLSALLAEASQAGVPQDKVRQAILEANKVAGEIRKALNLPAAGSTDPNTDGLLEQRLKNIVPDPAADRLDLMRQALKVGRSKVDAVRVTWDPGVPQTHPQFKRLTELVVEGASGETAPDRVKAALKEAYDLAGTILKDLPAVVPVRKDPPAADPEWGSKLDDLMKKFQALYLRLSGTSAGVLMATPGPIKDPDQAVKGLKERDREPVKRLLVLRDQFLLGIPRTQVASVKLAEIRGKGPAAEVEKASAGVKAQYDALAKAFTEMEKLAAKLGAKPAAYSWDADEAEFKKTMAEYDALTLRLVNTATGRALALVEDLIPSEQMLEGAGVAKAAQPTARKLFSLRAKILTQSREADKHVYNLHRWAADGSPGSPEDVQGLKFRNGALRGLVDDLKKLTDELDPPPTPDAEFRKLMEEYDALVLRLAKTPVGRLMVTTKPKEWKPGELAVSNLTPDEQHLVIRLLRLRDDVVAEKEKFDGDIRGRADSKDYKAKQEAAKGDPKIIAGHAEWIKQYEADMKLRVETVRGLVRDLKKLADEIDPPKGK